MMREERLAEEHYLAKDGVDRDTVYAVAEVLRATGRYGDDAAEAATDVLAALTVVKADTK